MTAQLATAFMSELPAGPPKWLHLLPPGSFSGVDGRGPYVVPDAGKIITASMGEQHRPLPVDVNHSTDHAMKSGIPSPAVGWVTELQARADGIWGRVQWTPAGRASLQAREYRYVSPVFEHTPDLVVNRVLRAALTNTPNLNLTALHSASASVPDRPSPERQRVLALMGVTEDEIAKFGSK